MGFLSILTLILILKKVNKFMDNTRYTRVNEMKSENLFQQPLDKAITSFINSEVIINKHNDLNNYLYILN